MYGLFNARCCTAIGIVCVAAGTALGDQSKTVARQLGLTPEVLVSAGYLPGELSTILGRIESAADERNGLAVAEECLSGAVLAEATAELALQTNPSDESLRARLRDAKAATVSARTSVLSAKSQIRALALGAEDARQSVVLRILAVPAASIPVQYRVLQSATITWRALEAALTEEARSIRAGASLSDDMVSVLAAVRSDGAVISAQQLLAANLQAMKSAWDQS